MTHDIDDRSALSERKPVTIRPAEPGDLPDLRRAVVELQDYERGLHATRLPGEQIADAYLAWLQQKAAETGVLLVAEIAGLFVGFIAGWIVEEHSITETADSRRAGYVSDICIMPGHRGHRIAGDLLFAIERYFVGAGITRVRIASLAANASAQAAYRRAGYQPYEAIYEKIIGTG